MPSGEDSRYKDQDQASQLRLVIPDVAAFLVGFLRSTRSRIPWALSRAVVLGLE
jgi:hypothetical protein